VYDGRRRSRSRESTAGVLDTRNRVDDAKIPGPWTGLGSGLGGELAHADAPETVRWGAL
jgi:hypothetical protein